MERNSREHSDHIIKKTNESLFYRLVLKGGQQIAALIFGILLARLLSPAEFGVVAVANLIIHYANNFTNFGLNNALVQNDNIERTHINTVFTIDLAISTTLLVGTILAADSIANFFHNPDVGPVLKWMALYYVITTFYHIPVVILRRAIDFRFLTVVEFVEGVLTSGVAIMLAWFGFSYWSIVIPSLAVPALVSIILMMHTHWRPGLVLGDNMTGLYSFGFWSFVRAQVQLIVSKVDYFVIGRYLSPEYLGLYEKSFELTDRAMTGVTMPVNSIFFSTFSRMKEDVAQLKQVFLEGTSLLAIVCYPILFGVIGVAPHFVTSCLGNRWEGMIVPLQILASAGVLRALLGLISSVNVAVGYFKIHTLFSIVCAVIFIFLCFSTVDKGIVAVCMSYFAYCFLSFCASFFLVYLNVGVQMVEMVRALICPFGGSVIMLIVIVIMRILFFKNSSSLLELFILVIVGAILYSSWIYFFYKKGIVRFKINGVVGKRV